MKTTKLKRSAKELDKKFDKGSEDILDQFDTQNTIRRVLVDFPEWMIASLDLEAKHLGISRQAVIKTWINEKIKENGAQLKAVA